MRRVVQWAPFGARARRVHGRRGGLQLQTRSNLRRFRKRCGFRACPAFLVLKTRCGWINLLCFQFLMYAFPREAREREIWIALPGRTPSWNSTNFQGRPYCAARPGSQKSRHGWPLRMLRHRQCSAPPCGRLSGRAEHVPGRAGPGAKRLRCLELPI